MRGNFPVRDVEFVRLDELSTSSNQGVKVVDVHLEKPRENLIIEHNPSVKVFASCKGWGFHVWGTKAYSVLHLCPKSVKVVIVRSLEEFEVKRQTNGWITFAYSKTGFVPDPWLPISVYIEAKEVSSPFREGLLLIAPLR